MHDAFSKSRVFISYASPDSEFAEWLDHELQSRHLLTWLDKREVKTGDRLTQTLGTALTEARAVVVVLSPAVAKARWMALELGTAVHRMVSEPNFRLLPALIADTEIPGEIRDIVYADFRVDRTSGLQALLSALDEVMRDDWHFRYRQRKAQIEAAIEPAFGRIIFATMMGGYNTRNIELVLLQADESEVEIAIEVDPSRVDEWWLDGFTEHMGDYHARLGIVIVAEPITSNLLEPVDEGILRAPRGPIFFMLIPRDMPIEQSRERVARLSDLLREEIAG